ncbi:MAG: inositol monophosphatase family protein [Thermofilaceae archaeon]|jgi:myo-inositol-1(or 4)-monophosphatase
MGYDGVLAVIREAARRAGEAALRVREQGHAGEVVGRGSGGDVTLRGDLEAERVAVEYLLSHADCAAVVSEEMGEKVVGGRGYVFVVDPLDGSRNYKRGSPLFAVSIAAAVGRTLEDVVAGFVYAPAMGLEVYAARGSGAYVNGRKLVASGGDGEGLVFVGASPKASFLPYAYMLGLSARGFIVRSLGSASLELSSVATGGADAYVDAWGTMRVVDIAAAYLVVREAGAWVVTEGFLGNPPLLSLEERLAIAAARTESLGRELLELLAEQLGLEMGSIFKVVGLNARAQSPP